jgi:hypothetical protein
MPLGKRFRQVWHDIFYAKPSEKRVEFAMRCKDVIHHIDHGVSHMGWKHWFRLKLHLSLCQVCKNYFDFSRFLNRSLHTLLGKRPSEQDLEKLNKRLLDKFKP